MELFGWGMNSMLVCLTALGLVQLQSSWNSAILSSIFGYPMYLAAALNAVALFFCRWTEKMEFLPKINAHISTTFSSFSALGIFYYT
jgi:hypothetical protein